MHSQVALDSDVVPVVSVAGFELGGVVQSPSAEAVARCPCVLYSHKSHLIPLQRSFQLVHRAGERALASVELEELSAR